MSERDNLLGACGMVCGECLIRKAANDKDFAEKLAEGWRNAGHPAAKAEWFKCQGCHGPEDLIWTEDCRTRKCCVKDRNLKNCSQCGEFPCRPHADDGNASHKAAFDRLMQMKESSKKNN